MKQTFYSNGKLLITGEYVVLDGATAFALPTSYGQYLHIEDGSNNVINWISRDADGNVWLEAAIPLSVIISNNQDSQRKEINTLINILHEAYRANPETIVASKGFKVITEVTFPRQWGLGTSSTLINNIAQWFGINAFALLNKSFGGSGYDIACAQHNTPILYRLKNKQPVVEPVVFSPSFAGNLYFVYLNKKQNSRSAIEAYKQKQGNIEAAVREISSITKDILHAADISSFKSAIEKHEGVMSGLLEQTTVKEVLFPDFKGTVKSLGAWGGDFVLVVAESDPSAYFNKKGYNIVIPYHKMIL